MMIARLVPALAIVVAGCTSPSEDLSKSGTAEPTPASAAAAAAPAGPRGLGDAERDAMLAVLGEETSTKKVWFAVNPGNTETAALKNQLEEIFKQAGWETATQTVTGMNLKAGIYFMAADETPPPYVETAQRAVEASGLEIKTGSGYRAYYDEKRNEDPKWAGIALAPDQDYVVVIGPRPTA